MPSTHTGDTAGAEVAPPWATYIVDSPDQAFLMAVLFDYDGDGLLDVIAGTADEGTYLWRFPEPGGLTWGTNDAMKIDVVGTGYAVADMDADGDLDLVSHLHTLFGTYVDITFTGAEGDRALTLLGDSSYLGCIADLSADGHLDIVGFVASATLTVTHGPFSPGPLRSSNEQTMYLYGYGDELGAGSNTMAQCADINGDGFVDLVTKNLTALATGGDEALAFLGPFDASQPTLTPYPLGLDMPLLLDLEILKGLSGEATHLAAAVEQADGFEYLLWYKLPLDLLDPTPVGRLAFDPTYEGYTTQLRSAGDVNADGTDDIMVIRSRRGRWEWSVFVSPFEGLLDVTQPFASGAADAPFGLASAADADGAGVVDGLLMTGVRTVDPYVELHLRGEEVP